MDSPIRATRDNIVVRQLEPLRRSSGGIDLLGMPNEYSRVEVLSMGPDCYGFEEGDILWCLGFRSGIVLDRDQDLYLVSQQICHAVVEEEE